MWWVVVLLLILFCFSYREGMDVEADGSSDAQLQQNKLLIADLTDKVKTLTAVADKVAPLETRLQDCNTKLDDIAKLCVT